MERYSDGKLLEILQQEVFLAFFDFRKIGENGESEIDGLCKVARPQGLDEVDYLSLTFIFDTPTEGKKALAKRIMSSLSTEAFRKNLSNVRAMTSVPATVRPSENYVHQTDVIFNAPIKGDIREVVKKIVYTIRNSAKLNTEVPQWWDENEAPAPSAAEKANWSARIKAFLGLK